MEWNRGAGGREEGGERRREREGEGGRKARCSGVIAI